MLLKRQCVTPPRHVLPAPEVAKEVWRAGVPEEREVVEPQWLEAAMKAAEGTSIGHLPDF
jgi:hypothetical protein